MKGIILVAPEGVNINISIIESEYTITMKELKKITRKSEKYPFDGTKRKKHKSRKSADPNHHT